MPMYEYACDICGKAFEELVRGSEKIQCPECGSERVTRKLSTFAGCCGGGKSGGSDVASGSCTTGCCPFA